MILAMDRNRVIGLDNDIPWRLPADLKRFKSVTMGKPIIMGRKTYESIGRPLPGRHNIVVTRSKGYQAEGCTVVGSLNEALAAAIGSEEVMIIGGATLYEQLLPCADRLYLTLIEANVEGDTFFPEIEITKWEEVSQETFEADDTNPFAFRIVTLDRRRRNQ
jgi:dihydrofolate reductase